MPNTLLVEYWRESYSDHDVYKIDRWKGILILSRNLSPPWLSFEEADEVLAQGMKAAEQGDVDEGIKLLKLATRTQGRWASARIAYYNLGLLFEKKGDVENAYSNYGYASADQTFMLAYYKMALLDYKKGKLLWSKRNFDYALGLDPKFAQGYEDRGLVYEAMGQYAIAIEDYTKAIELEPGRASAYFKRGLAFRQLGQKLEAIRELETFISLSDDAQKIDEARQIIEELQR